MAFRPDSASAEEPFAAVRDGGDSGADPRPGPAAAEEPLSADESFAADEPLSAEEPFAAEMARFDELVRTLRARCPWDREQTHASLRRHLLEETYETLEVLDAIAALDGADAPGSLDDSLCEELGDLLYQVWFHARLASERGAFGAADVARNVHDKLVARHPHVFGDVEAGDADTVRANWDVIKQAEKGRDSTMDGIPATLPALLRAVKVVKRAAAAGLTDQASAPSMFDDTARMLGELRAEPTEQGLGDLLLTVVALARRLAIDPEDALRSATERAEQQYRQAEQAVRGSGSPSR